jgi:hypothetical protein
MPSAGQDGAEKLLDQQRIVAFVVVGGQRREVALAQGPQGALPPVLVIEERRVRLAVDEGIGVAVPVLGPLDLGDKREAAASSP